MTQQSQFYSASLVLHIYINSLPNSIYDIFRIVTKISDTTYLNFQITKFVTYFIDTNFLLFSYLFDKTTILCNSRFFMQNNSSLRLTSKPWVYFIDKLAIWEAQQPMLHRNHVAIAHTSHCILHFFAPLMQSKKSLKILRDKKVPNSIELIIEGETHTLANLLTEKLLNDERCVYSAYKVLHPLEEKVNIKVTASKGCDVILLVTETLQSMSNEIEDCKSKFYDACGNGGMI